MEPILTRRRFLTISAAAAALPARAGVPETARWRGQALGAGASMTLAGLDEAAAAPVFAAVEAELARLEKIFSLYREDSDLSRLNRTGNLTAPPLEMLEVLALSDRLNRATGGAFDPSVQPLWQALAAGRGLDDRARAGWEHVHFDAGEVRLARPGMALTFNGIAQGYITDRIAALLAARGLTDLLIDMGEVVARGRRGDGAPWRAGIARPDGRILQRLTLTDRALATSAPLGTVLDPAGRMGHILDPRTGATAAAQPLVSVSARSAALADGLSTACCLLTGAEIASVLTRFAGARLEHPI